MSGLTGLMRDATPGRADAIHTHIPAHSYVIPADVVSGIGQGNTAAGAKVLDAVCHHAPKAQPPSREMVKVRLSGGEYRIPPEVVTGMGRGNPKKGSDHFDDLVKQIRSKTVADIKSQKPPKG